MFSDKQDTTTYRGMGWDTRRLLVGKGIVLVLATKSSWLCGISLHAVNTKFIALSRVRQIYRELRQSEDFFE